MTFVSYAQNFEDVMLWRALKDVPRGFYIDVGASHPDRDSVTRAFYDRGWHGINIEPNPHVHARLAAARARDVTLCCAAGASPGRAAFHAVGGAEAGLSTFDAEAVLRYAALGFSARSIEVEVRKLADICAEHAPAEVHFLKIDVEGAERDVLEGADLARWRPWVVLAEATAPMSTAEVHAGWEGTLLAAGYVFVWFDGLNRFYVPEERHAALAPAFRVPPNIFDAFVRANDTDWALRIGDAEQRAAVAAEALAAARQAAEAATARAARADEELDRLHRALEEAADALRRAEQARDAALGGLEATRRSLSWRVTAPLRALGGR